MNEVVTATGTQENDLRARKHLLNGVGRGITMSPVYGYGGIEFFSPGIRRGLSGPFHPSPVSWGRALLA